MRLSFNRLSPKDQQMLAALHVSCTFNAVAPAVVAINESVAIVFGIAYCRRVAAGGHKDNFVPCQVTATTESARPHQVGD